MEAGFFRTVLGDLETNEMGLTYSHEHIIIEDSYPTAAHPEFLLNDVEKTSSELSGFFKKGGRTVVDTMPSNCGRNVRFVLHTDTNCLTFFTGNQRKIIRRNRKLLAKEKIKKLNYEKHS